MLPCWLGVNGGDTGELPKQVGKLKGDYPTTRFVDLLTSMAIACPMWMPESDYRVNRLALLSAEVVDVLGEISRWPFKQAAEVGSHNVELTGRDSFIRADPCIDLPCGHA